VNIGEARECPSCGDRAQPEQDGDLIYYACGCGHEFGYQRVQQEQDSSCQLGVPEEIRKGYSLAHLATLDSLTPAEEARLTGIAGPSEERVVFLGSIIPLRPEDN
jgi:hypothetical protein